MPLTDLDLDDLRYAKRLLEHPSVAARIANAIGAPIEALMAHLPREASGLIASATTTSLNKALAFAVGSLDSRRRSPSNGVHKAAVALTGAAGGAFGLGALAIELPVSTTVMLRSIADIARSEGELLGSPDTKLACMQVFALGGQTQADKATDSGYFAVRATLARAVAEAAEFLAERGVAREGAPAIVRFVSQVAARFGVPVSEKVMAQSVPIIGAAGGAIINVVFIDHFQDVARGHFIVRRLERKHGPELVRSEYLSLQA